MHGDWLEVAHIGAAGLEDINRDMPAWVEVREGSLLFAIGAVSVGLMSRLVWIVARLDRRPRPDPPALTEPFFTAMT
jgi:hypothetical protein